MIGRTLGRYIGARFLRWILGVFLVGTAIILLLDFFELVRRAGDREGFSVGRAFLTSLMRTPALTEQFLPFAALFGSIFAFIGLARRSELVVIRAAGVSVWQFAAPAIVVALGLGIAEATIYNPLSAWMKQQSEVVGASLFGREQQILDQTASRAWFRQNGTDGESIVHARSSTDQGAALAGLTVFLFGRDGEFSERIEASRAVLEDGFWRLEDAVVYRASGEWERHDVYRLSTFLNPTEVREVLARPDAVAFWQLPGLIALAEHAGLPAFRYRLQFQILMARPLLLVSMVLIAATVSLRPARFGGVTRMVARGVAAGFMLYVATELARDLGGAGIVPPPVAAWTPGLIACLFGVSVLLFREDG